jgi:MarR family transcriptional regulator, 2-MHQ and catechol-resistance regulon repressor
MTKPTPTPLQREAAELQAALAELVRVHQVRDRDQICCHDVSVTQCNALEVLLEKGEMTLGALAAELYLDKSTTSRVVGALERKGYVVRAPHPDDGRAVLLAPTERGRGLCTAIQDELISQAAALIQDLEPSVRQGAVVLLRRLAAATRQRYGLGGGGCCGV